MKRHNPRFLNLVDEARERIQETTVDAIAKRLQDPEDNVILVDVREASEWQEGHLPGAIHLCKGVLERDVETRFPDPTTELILYCGGGYRSALAADALRRMGYENAISMDGGFRTWAGAGHPVEAD